MYLDSDDNASLYSQYNAFRREKVNGKSSERQPPLTASLFNLETEQLVFYKIIRDIIRGRWVVVVGGDGIMRVDPS